MERRMAEKSIIQRDCGPLIGMCINEVVAALGLPVDQCLVFDEPPMVGRGVRWHTPDLCVHIWVARQAGVFRRDHNWDVTEFLPLRAVGIQVDEYLGTRREWWAGGSRFSEQSQKVSPNHPGTATDFEITSP